MGLGMSINCQYCTLSCFGLHFCWSGWSGMQSGFHACAVDKGSIQWIVLKMLGCYWTTMCLGICNSTHFFKQLLQPPC